ncbi:hypothetical protein TNCV_2524741 [Trichonephila clavipes]|nr:hypothetical protein TNCV_2524741 [Trichonephila clavipes]
MCFLTGIGKGMGLDFLVSQLEPRIIRGIFSSDKKGSSAHHCNHIAQISGGSSSSQANFRSQSSYNKHSSLTV